MALNVGLNKDSTLEEFNLFPKLPTEIRLKIWRATFPPSRHIELQLYDYRNSLLRKPLLEKWPPSPVSLFINQESRQETKRYYDTVYCRYDVGTGLEKAQAYLKYTTIKRATFISPGRDTLLLDGSLAMFRSREIKYMIVQLRRQLKEGLKAIRAVEFRGFDWPKAFISTGPVYVDHRSDMRRLIAEFQGMRTLDFVMITKKSEIYRESCTAVVKGFLEGHEDSYGGVLPKVTFIPAIDSTIEDRI